MESSLGVQLRASQKRFVVVLLAFALAIPMLCIPTVAHAATSMSRVGSFTAGPATVTKGKAITVTAQAQRLSGKSWVKTGAVKATVYFDADGSASNKAMRTVTTNRSGYVKTTLTATASGKWTIRWTKQGSLTAASSSSRHVKVVAAPKPSSSKPVSKWNCPAWAPIKGNAPSKIYHMKGQRFYLKTTPEICFSTEAAAKKAGYRKSKV